MSQIYHGCFRKNEDGTNRIIANGERCLLPICHQFWKDVNDIPAGMRTRAQYKQQKLVLNRTYNKCFRDKRRKDIEPWLTADDSKVVILNESDSFYLVP